MSGKGSGRRPATITREEWERRHALAFPQKPRPQPRRKPRRQK